VKVACPVVAWKVEEARSIALRAPEKDVEVTSVIPQLVPRTLMSCAEFAVYEVVAWTVTVPPVKYAGPAKAPETDVVNANVVAPVVQLIPPPELMLADAASLIVMPEAPVEAIEKDPDAEIDVAPVLVLVNPVVSTKEIAPSD